MYYAIIFFVFWPIYTFVVYLGASFIALSFSILEWHLLLRIAALACIVWGLVAGFSTAYDVTKREKDEKK